MSLKIYRHIFLLVCTSFIYLFPTEASTVLSWNEFTPQDVDTLIAKGKYPHARNGPHPPARLSGQHDSNVRGERHVLQPGSMVDLECHSNRARELLRRYCRGIHEYGPTLCFRARCAGGNPFR